MEHFITEIRIENVRHLKNINIALNNQNRQHLILTGKNGSGKTSVLEEISKNLALINRNVLKNYRDLKKNKGLLNLNKALLSSYSNLGLDVIYNSEDELAELYRHGDFITAFFNATPAIERHNFSSRR